MLTNVLNKGINFKFKNIFRYTETIESLERDIEENKKSVHKLMKDLNLSENNGVCIKSLNDTLKKLHVERQAYHSLSFIGNHCHKLLQVKTYIFHNS